MNFAAISHEGILQYSCLQNRPVQFCLAQHYLNPALGLYKDFYDQAVKNGCTVILDNGCYEDELVSFSDLYRVCQELQPSIVILPDKLRDPKITKYLSIAFLNYIGAMQTPGDMLGRWPSFMQVLHGPSIWDLLKQYREAPTSWIGLPRHLGGLRVELCKRLHELGLWNEAISIHALGMNDGDIEEWQELEKLGVASADSSRPLRRGLKIADTKFDVSYSTFINEYSVKSALQKVDSCLHPSPWAPPSPSPGEVDIPF